MRIAAAALMLSIGLAASPAYGAGKQQNTGASNSGTSVNVHASETETQGGGGPGSSRGRSGPAIDYEARYQSLINAMALEQLRETDRRLNESAVHRNLTHTRDECTRLADYHEARGLRRVLVTERVQVTERVLVYEHIPYYVAVHVPVVIYERIPTVRHYYVWVRRGWRWTLERRTRISWEVRAITTYRVEHRLQWRVEPRWVTRTVWTTVERWEWQGSPIHTVLGVSYRACANAADRAIANHRRVVEERRAAWNDQWADLNRAGHEAWRVINTTCRTIREVGPNDIQECAYGAWRNYSPGSFERTIYVPPAPPPQTIIRQARDQITPPGPVIRMSPRVEWEQIVQFPTWLWIEPSAWRPATARADAGRAWAEATATPTRVVWDMGNGDRVVCTGPGSVFDEGRPDASQRTGCSYTYRQSSSGQPNDAYTVTATLVYDVTWQGSGGAGGDLGTITQTSAVPVRVAELQALVTGAG